MKSEISLDLSLERVSFSNLKLVSQEGGSVLIEVEEMPALIAALQSFQQSVLPTGGTLRRLECFCTEEYISPENLPVPPTSG